jgi:Carbohydrate family 9 binding domain-like
LGAGKSSFFFPMGIGAKISWITNSRLRLICLLLLPAFVTGAKRPDSNALAYSTRAEADIKLDTDPASPFWRAARPVSAEVDNQGWLEREYRTEIRSRWTRNNIYFLFRCPYKHLYLNPKPDPVQETYELWKWNVAEVFIGSDFQNIKRYKEFEISPQGEWVDLDINLDNPHHEEGWVWNSGFEHAARIDESKHIWYVALRIPFSALDISAAAAGQQFRVNFYRTEGEGREARAVMWRPTVSKTFHAPESFGLLKLAEK